MQDAELAGRLLQIGLRVIQRTLREQCPDAPPVVRSGGVTYIHRFGSALNAHLHFHTPAASSPLSRGVCTECTTAGTGNKKGGAAGHR